MLCPKPGGEREAGSFALVVLNPILLLFGVKGTGTLQSNVDTGTHPCTGPRSYYGSHCWPHQNFPLRGQMHMLALRITKQRHQVGVVGGT